MLGGVRVSAIQDPLDAITLMVASEGATRGCISIDNTEVEDGFPPSSLACFT